MCHTHGVYTSGSHCRRQMQEKNTSMIDIEYETAFCSSTEREGHCCSTRVAQCRMAASAPSNLPEDGDIDILYLSAKKHD